MLNCSKEFFAMFNSEIFDQRIGTALKRKTLLVVVRYKVLIDDLSNVHIVFGLSLLTGTDP